MVKDVVAVRGGVGPVLHPLTQSKAFLGPQGSSGRLCRPSCWPCRWTPSMRPPRALQPLCRHGSLCREAVHTRAHRVGNASASGAAMSHRDPPCVGDVVAAAGDVWCWEAWEGEVVEGGGLGVRDGRRLSGRDVLEEVG